MHDEIARLFQIGDLCIELNELKYLKLASDCGWIYIKGHVNS